MHNQGAHFAHYHIVVPFYGATSFEERATFLLEGGAWVALKLPFLALKLIIYDSFVGTYVAFTYLR